jgi:hypothetical protein
MPRCANGSSLAYSLSGPVDLSDVAITGGGAGKQEQQAFQWLYDFEEQEGEINFLTRLVSIRFYPAASGVSMSLGQVQPQFAQVVNNSSPLKSATGHLGSTSMAVVLEHQIVTPVLSSMLCSLHKSIVQVEILGASLVWTALGRTSGTCSHRKAFGPRRDTFAAYLQQKNPRLDLLSLEDGEDDSVQSTPSSSNQVFDLLTGDYIVPVSTLSGERLPGLSLSSNGTSSIKSTETINATDPGTHNPSKNNLTSSSNSTGSLKASKSPKTQKSVSQEDPGVEVYLDLLKTLYGTSPVSFEILGYACFC